MWTLKVMHIGFQIWAEWRIGLEAIIIMCLKANNMSVFHAHSETLWKVKFNSSGVINLTKKASGQHSIQVKAWILLASLYRHSLLMTKLYSCN